MTRPTVHDIAKAAGVSLATVDRVLNARPGVRAKTVERVQAAIAEIGYTRDLTAANLARQRIYRFVFVLPEGVSEFLEDLRACIAETAIQLAERTRVRVINVDSRDPHALLRALDGLAPETIDGVAIMAHETPVVRDAIARLDRRGIEVVSLVTDQAGAARSHFVGIDNLAAGRTAAMLMGRFVGPRAGTVAVMVNSTLARDMVERRLGFDQVMAERFPYLRPLPSLEGHDDREQSARVLATCLGSRDDIVGIYAAGAGTRGMMRAVEEHGGAGRFVTIAHELTPHARSGLEDGTIDAVITQDTGHIARSAIRVLRARCDRTPIVAAQERIRIEIVLRENLP